MSSYDDNRRSGSVGGSRSTSPSHQESQESAGSRSPHSTPSSPGPLHGVATPSSPTSDAIPTTTISSGGILRVRIGADSAPTRINEDDAHDQTPSSPFDHDTLPSAIVDDASLSSVSSTARRYANVPLQSTAQSQTAPHLHVIPHLPLPEREDSTHGRPIRPITFGTLKKASMSNRASSLAAVSSSVTALNKSKITSLPSYFRHTTFKQHFQPEGPAIDRLSSISSSTAEREPSKRRRLLVDSSRRRSMHFHLDNDISSNSSSGESSSSSGSDSSSGSESGNSLCDNHNRARILHSDRRPLRYQLPSRWSTIDKTDKTRLSEDDLQVHYSGPGKVDSDASSIRANRPIPPQCGVYYFEIFIKSKGQQGYIGIGVCSAMVDLNRLPGWEPHSWGYHGDDGNSFGGCGNGRPYGPVFTTGDTIGCGINFRDMSMFYTKNGAYLGVAFRDLKGPLYPTVGMRTPGEIVEANFGQRDFAFDIEDYVKNEKAEAWRALENTLQSETLEKHQINNLSQSLNQLVLSYMIHHGFSESAKQFSNDLVLQPSRLNSASAGSSSTATTTVLISLPPMVIDAERRKVIRNAILEGEIDKAMDLLERYYPGISMENGDMLLQLRCRKFIEMVILASSPLSKLDQRELSNKSKDKGKGKGKDRSSHHTPMDIDMKESSSDLAPEHMDIDRVHMTPLQREEDAVDLMELEDLGLLKDAIQYGQLLQEQYKDNRDPQVQEMLIDAFSVLAYSDVEHPSDRLTHSSSPTSRSHRHGHPHRQGGSKPLSRETLACTVNTTILASQDLPTTAPLETAYRQTSAVLSELTQLGVGTVAFFDLEKDCVERGS
ncbi:hypothetical protein EDD11_008390 [Mortierella claussenii]|nr:hypothetical protein EDD11_008390 [Mortierella claussenii]